MSWRIATQNDIFFVLVLLTHTGTTPFKESERRGRTLKCIPISSTTHTADVRKLEFMDSKKALHSAKKLGRVISGWYFCNFLIFSSKWFFKSYTICLFKLKDAGNFFPFSSHATPRMTTKKLRKHLMYTGIFLFNLYCTNAYAASHIKGYMIK